MFSWGQGRDFGVASLGQDIKILPNAGQENGEDLKEPAAQTNLLLAECEVRTASYEPRFFLPFMAQARSARAMKTRKEKTRIHNLPYGPSKRG